MICVFVVRVVCICVGTACCEYVLVQCVVCIIFVLCFVCILCVCAPLCICHVLCVCYVCLYHVLCLCYVCLCYVLCVYPNCIFALHQINIIWNLFSMYRIIDCLMDNMDEDEMTDECEDKLLEIQFFVVRDFRYGHSSALPFLIFSVSNHSGLNGVREREILQCLLPGSIPNK